MTLARLTAPRALDDLLNYRLVRLIAVSGAPVIRLCEGRYGISRREWRIVALLAAGGTLSPSDLAAHANLDRARTSRAITALVVKGFVHRVTLANDKRRARVGLTAEGRHLYDELFPQVVEINRQVLAVLDESLIAQIDAALDRLTEHAAKVNQQVVQDAHADRYRGSRGRVRPEEME
jgi:DNA-binding MarR family transcriptional regulator